MTADVRASLRPLGPPSATEITPDEVRGRVAALLAGPEAAEGWRLYHAGDEPDPRALYALLGAHRLLAPAWPVAYGGRGLTPHHQAAVVHGLVEAGVSETLHTLSVQIAGSFLLAAASRAQRASILPDLAAGQSFATILYSEPEAGSDLAALTTTAERDPAGGWRVTGRKVYSVKTRYADFGLVAARTSVEDSRYQGISLLFVPLHSPGVEIQPLASIADEQFADVTLDGVWVSDSAVVGPVGHAWPLITEALALERTGVDYHAKAVRWLALWLEYAHAADGGLDAAQRIELARLSAKIEAAGLFADRCLTHLASGHVDPVLAAMTKLWSADTAREIAWWCTEESGADGLVVAGNGRIESAYREAPGLTISAGTAEMMLEVVAGSGLPVPGGDVPGLDEEPLARALRGAVRAIAAVYDDRDDSLTWWVELAEIGAFGLAVRVPDGGLDLGLAASTIVCEELGRGLLDGGVLDTLAAIDVYAASPRRSVDRLSAAMAGEYRAVILHERSASPARPAPADAIAPAPALWPDGVDEVVVLGDGIAVCTMPPTAAVPSCSDAPLRTPLAIREPAWRPNVDVATIVERDRIRRAAWFVGVATGRSAKPCVECDIVISSVVH